MAVIVRTSDSRRLGGDGGGGGVAAAAASTIARFGAFTRRRSGLSCWEGSRKSVARHAWTHAVGLMCNRTKRLFSLLSIRRPLPVAQK